MLIASEVYDVRHQLAATFYVQHRRPAKLREIPEFFQQAILAVEDHRFYEHKGLNPGRLIKAAWHDLRQRSIKQGGSTITQQLAKNLFLSHERSFQRKLKELYYTFKLELSLSKDEILERYLNEVYFGHGAYGIKVAAFTYFGKEMNELSEAEMALLAGLPRGPSYYSPYNHPKNARQRMRLVLMRMLECGYISEEEYHQYVNQPVTLPGLKSNNSAPYFMDWVQQEVNRLLPGDPEIIYTGGLRIESTIDNHMQAAANQAFDRGLKPILVDPRGVPQPQGSLIAMDPKNGEIRALIGGVDFSKSTFNRALQAKRQPGSSFKPLLYAKALEDKFTLASGFDLTPVTYYVQGKAYCPTDHGDKNAQGKITLRDALARSSNVVAVQLIKKVGPQKVAEFAHRLGIKSSLVPSLSLALGTSEVTPLEMVTAYTPLANGGIRFNPSIIRRITDHKGKVLYERPEPKGKQVLNPKISFLITEALTGVLSPGGTAANVSHILRRPAAGKTGTTEKNRDAWFIGYTPQLLSVVYIGCDNYEKSLPGAANRVAAPIWADFMCNALDGLPKQSFGGSSRLKLKTASVCRVTGLAPTLYCPTRNEYFVAGTEPSAACEEHCRTEVKVCHRSLLLPGPYCRDTGLRVFSPSDIPSAVCSSCEKRDTSRETMDSGDDSQDQITDEKSEEEEKGLKKFFKKIFRKKKQE